MSKTEKEREATPKDDKKRKDWLSNDENTVGSMMLGAEVVPMHWQDITEAFRNSCADLKVGDLVHDEYFSLYEGMSAAELMDPKMDSGMIYKNCKSTLSFEEAVEKEQISIDNFTAAQLIGIVDEIFGCVATWLEGQPLVQTVYTCLYLHRVELIKDAYLKAFCVGILKSCEFIWLIIQNSQVCEEEDFCCQTHGYTLQTDIANVKAIAMLKELDETWARNVKKSSHKSGEEWNEESKIKNDVSQGLHARIKFCRLLFSFLHQLVGVKVNEPFSELVKSSNVKLQSMRSLIPIIKDTCKLGIQAEINNQSDQTGYTSMIGFDPLICIKNVPSQFPKTVRIMDRSKAIEHLEKLLIRSIHVSEVIELPSIDNIIVFYTNFSSTSPCVLSRSLLQFYFYEFFKPFNDKKFMAELVKRAVKNFTRPPILSNPALRTYHRAIEISEAFFDRSEGREKIPGLLEEFSAMQEEASQCDEQLTVLLEKNDSQLNHRTYLGAWGLCHTCKIMEHYIVLGFELELYAIYEYYYIYWYLDYVYSHHLSCLYTADKHVQAYEASLIDSRKSKNKKSKKKKKASEHFLDTHLLDAKQSMCKGYLRAIDGFIKDGKMVQRNSKYDNEKLRYEHRFLPFHNVYSPQLVTYERFIEVREYTRSAVSQVTDFYSLSAKFFTRAKTTLEEITKVTDDVTALLVTVKTNIVVMNLLASGHKKESKVCPVFSFDVDKYFPIIRVQ